MTAADLIDHADACRTLLAYLRSRLEQPAPLPPLIAARTLIGLEDVRIALHRLAEAVEDAQRSNADGSGGCDK
jgi:hypothetical protein